MVVINYGASYLQETTVGKVAEEVLFDMRRAMMQQLQRVTLGWMDKTEVGRLMSRLQGDVNSMQEFLETSVMSVGDIVLLFGIVIVLLSLNFWLGLLTLATMPTLFIVRLFWLPPAKRSFMEAHETNSRANGALAEGINGVRTVQSLNRQRVNFDLYDEKSYTNLKAHLRAAKFAQVTIPIVDTLTGISMATVIVVGRRDWCITPSTLDLGVMVAYLFYIQRFFDPIRSLTMQYSVMQRAMASRRAHHRDARCSDRHPGGRSRRRSTLDALRHGMGRSTFRDVTINCRRKGQPVLKNVSFTDQPRARRWHWSGRPDRARPRRWR